MSDGSDEGVRRDLAAVFRLIARFGWHEAVANHCSAVVDGGEQFLLNPIGRHFARMQPDDLRLLPIVAPAVAPAGHEVPDGIDVTAWHLHAQVHRLVPHAKVVLHTHQPYATTLACLDGYEFQMLDQNACRFFGRVAYDREYGGMFMEESAGERVARLLGEHHAVLLLGNHGVMVVGETVADAFDELVYFEHACRLQVLALSTGRPLAVLDDAVAATTRAQWAAYPGDAARAHLDELIAIMDEESRSRR